MAEGTYLYAVAREPLSTPAGVAGARVRTIEHDGLVAYVSSVPLDTFGEEPLRRSLEDLDWLAETARAHHRVVDAVAAATTTAPVRLVTVYAGDDQVQDLLTRRGTAFHRVLSHVTGRNEWGVKVYTTLSDPGQEKTPEAAGTRSSRRAAEGTGPDTGAPAHPSPSGAASARHDRDDGTYGRPGRAYLERRRASLRGREQLRKQALRRADHIHRTLSALAADGCRHRPQDPRLSGRHDWMLLNGAYLVDEARATEFAELAGTLGGDGVEIRLTGPWAPYSFTVMETT
ncbi:GvpL/GvpF family gas vesicle protein [Nonomuraea sp. NPDC049504]|uniref:GvpL/GvpF family gas vesicle protein n=1 Tax=Nonomuraea sp. NPDC049504 TaxID=3154729 RepID=UPI00341DD828